MFFVTGKTVGVCQKGRDPMMELVATTLVSSMLIKNGCASVPGRGGKTIRIVGLVSEHTCIRLLAVTPKTWMWSTGGTATMYKD